MPQSPTNSWIVGSQVDVATAQYDRPCPVSGRAENHTAAHDVCERRHRLLGNAPAPNRHKFHRQNRRPPHLRKDSLLVSEAMILSYQALEPFYPLLSVPFSLRWLRITRSDRRKRGRTTRLDRTVESLFVHRSS